MVWKLLVCPGTCRRGVGQQSLRNWNSTEKIPFEIGTVQRRFPSKLEQYREDSFRNWNSTEKIPFEIGTVQRRFLRNWNSTEKIPFEIGTVQRRFLSKLEQCREDYGNAQTSKARKVTKKLFTLLDLCVSSLRRGHANLLCIVPILTDDPRRESEKV